jgi:TolA-binding protein
MKYFSLFIFVLAIALTGCKTKSDMRREQDVERLRAELREVKGDRGEIENLNEDLKVELARMNNLLEERAQQSRTQVEELRAELNTLSQKVQAMEAKADSQAQLVAALQNSESNAKPAPAEKIKPSYELGKRYFDDGRYEEAVDILKIVARSKSKSDETKKAHFLLGEAHFANKEFASAALEFSDYKRLFPKDPQVPLAIYRQANAF